MNPKSQRGFTLIELMIVVAIIAVLAVIAGTAYRKYADKARSSEVYAMFGEIRAKEEAYRAENGVYCSTSATGPTNSTCAAGNEDVVFPVLLASGEPQPKVVTGAPWGWTTAALGINPGRSQLYCGYVAVAGKANDATDWGNAGARGQALWTGQTTPPNAAWWYMSAICDNDGTSSINQIYTSGINTTSVSIINEGR